MNIGDVVTQAEINPEASGLNRCTGPVQAC